MHQIYSSPNGRPFSKSRFRLGLMILGVFVLGMLFEPISRATGVRFDESTLPRSVALGVRTEGVPERGPLLDEYASLVGEMPAIVMWYEDWADATVSPFDPERLSTIVLRGATTMITWEPWDASKGAEQPEFALAAITRGDFDDYIRQSARDADAWGQQVFLRFGHEMNGTWHAWGRDVNGNEPEDFIAAWRHVVGIFRDEGATNVVWVWSPNIDYMARYPFTDLYPGDEWVDWVALDGYNWGAHNGIGWRSFAELFGPSYDILTGLTDKPVMIAEMASNEDGGEKGAWIRQGFLHDLPERMPRVEAVIWFNRDKETDWRVNSSEESLAAFREVVASPLFHGACVPFIGRCQN